MYQIVIRERGRNLVYAAVHCIGDAVQAVTNLRRNGHDAFYRLACVGCGE